MRGPLLPPPLLRENRFVHNRRLGELAEGVSLALHWRYSTPERHPKAVARMSFGQNFGAKIRSFQSVAIAADCAEFFEMAAVGLVSEVAERHEGIDGEACKQTLHGVMLVRMRSLGRRSSRRRWECGDGGDEAARLKSIVDRGSSCCCSAPPQRAVM